MAAHDRGERAHKLAALAVELHQVSPARLSPLEVEHLRSTVAAAGCDLSLSATRQWARARRLDPDAVAAWALERNAACDCELWRLLMVRHFMADQIPFNRVLGIEVGELREGFARLEVPFRPELVGDPFKPALHGGVLSAVIDACGGAAVFTMVVPPDTISTIDLRIDYLRPGQTRRIVCESTVARMGNRVASVDSRVYHPDAPDRLIATGKAVYSVKRVKLSASPASS
jgi:uncharacterized protein (TIGR00369 family)